MTRTSTRRTLSTLGGAVAAATILVLSAAGPASAHDQLVDVDPADGSTVTTVPTSITLTFNDTVLEVSPEMVVTDAAGAVVTDAAPTIDDTTVTQTLPSDLTDGVYDVEWRVVSSDGHPIDGTTTFTVDAPEAATTEAATPEATATATESADATSAADAVTPYAAATTPTTTTTDDGAPVGLLIGGAAVVAAALVTVVLVVRRNARATGGNGPRAGQD